MLASVAVLGVVASFVGWGLACTAALRKFAHLTMPGFDVGLHAGIGLAASLAAFGVLVGLGIHVLALQLVWCLAGIAFLSLHLLRSGNWGDRLRRYWISGTVMGVIVVSQTAYALVQPFVTMTGRPVGAPWQTCDDDVGYMYLINKLIDTRSLVEPFSLRRIASFGGQTSMQSLFVGLFGNRAPELFDLAVCTVVIALTFVVPRRTRIATIGAGAGLLTLLLFRDSQVNLSPLFSIVALTLVGLRLVSLALRTRDRRQRLGLVVLIGLVMAGLCALRANAVLVVAGIALPVLMIRASTWRERGRMAAVGGGTLAIALSGWSLGLWRSSRSPLFPVFHGTLVPDASGFRNSRLDVFDYIKTTWAVLGRGNTLMILIACLAVALVLLRRPSSAERSEGLVLSVSVLVLIVLTGVLAVTLSAFFDVELWRYLWPLVVSVALFGCGALLDLLGEVVTTRESSSVTVIAGGVLVALLVLVTPGLADESVSDLGQAIRDRGSLVKRAVSESGDLFGDRYAEIRTTYERAERDLPEGSSAAIAVDYPAAFDGRTRTLFNLDTVGTNSPAPSLPFFAGARVKLEYFADLGITHLIVVDPKASVCLYNEAGWRTNLKGYPSRDGRPAGVVYGIQAPRLLDWFADIHALVDVPSAAVKRYGNLYVIDVVGARSTG